MSRAQVSRCVSKRMLALIVLVRPSLLTGLDSVTLFMGWLFDRSVERVDHHKVLLFVNR